MPPNPYNTTQITPALAFEKHIYNRDNFAHYFRWTHALKHLKRGLKVLDLGCGTGEFAEVIYQNKLKAEKYLGLDVRELTIKNNKEYFAKQDWIHFEQKDLVKELIGEQEKFDLITSFEVIEHIGKYNGEAFLDNLAKFCNEKTTILLSTPCYHPRWKVGASLIYNPETKQREVGEFTYTELEKLLNKHFKIEKVYGTFASQKDYKPMIKDGSWEKEMYDTLKEYYDVNLLSNLMAPLFPNQSRNCLWVLTLRRPK
jgi:2-polyprenyl-3-methyl-5-hydroxy-6-metoxy-1,4-benzoquinol methylase